MLRIKILHDVVGTSRYLDEFCGLSRGERIEQGIGSLTQTNVADEAASTGVDVRHKGATTTITSLDTG
ncbi:hypothetical protein Tco_0641073 [Tanacetum coccineum]